MDESTPYSLEKKYYKDAMDWYYYLCVMLSHVQFFVTPQEPIRLLSPWNFPGKNTEVGCRFLLQGSS